MPSKPGIHYPGTLYQSILRGNAGAPVFRDAADRCRFYLMLQKGTVRFGFRFHAFCFMTNHIHLALQVDRVPGTVHNFDIIRSVDRDAWMKGEVV